MNSIIMEIPDTIIYESQVLRKGKLENRLKKI